MSIPLSGPPLITITSRFSLVSMFPFVFWKYVKNTKNNEKLAFVDIKYYIFSFLNPSGSGFYRIRHPYRYNPRSLMFPWLWSANAFDRNLISFMPQANGESSVVFSDSDPAMRRGPSICTLGQRYMLHRWLASQVPYSPPQSVDCDPPIRSRPLINQVWQLLCISLFMLPIVGFTLFFMCFFLPIVLFHHSKGSSPALILVFGMILLAFEYLKSIFGPIWIKTQCIYRCENNILKFGLWPKWSKRRCGR